MKKFLLNLGYVTTSLLFSALVVAGGWLLFFVNPINWKNFQDYGPWDGVWSWVSNGLIFALVIGLVVVAWTALWKIRKKLGS
jgi:hypothetical protein